MRRQTAGIDSRESGGKGMVMDYDLIDDIDGWLYPCMADLVLRHYRGESIDDICTKLEHDANNEGYTLANPDDCIANAYRECTDEAAEVADRYADADALIVVAKDFRERCKILGHSATRGEASLIMAADLIRARQAMTTPATHEYEIQRWDGAPAGRRYWAYDRSAGAIAEGSHADTVEAVRDWIAGVGGRLRPDACGPCRDCGVWGPRDQRGLGGNCGCASE